MGHDYPTIITFTSYIQITPHLSDIWQFNGEKTESTNDTANEDGKSNAHTPKLREMMKSAVLDMLFGNSQNSSSAEEGKKKVNEKSVLYLSINKYINSYCYCYNYCYYYCYYYY